MSATAPHDPAAGTATGDPAGSGWQARWQTARQGLALRWSAFAPRERRLLAIGGTVLAAFVVWAVAIAPAWRTLQSAPVQLDALDLQLQRMQGLAAEAATLRAVAPVPAAQAQAALTAATERLGAPGKLSLQGERARAAHAQGGQPGSTVGLAGRGPGGCPCPGGRSQAQPEWPGRL